MIVKRIISHSSKSAQLIPLFFLMFPRHLCEPLSTRILIKHYHIEHQILFDVRVPAGKDPLKFYKEILYNTLKKIDTHISMKY